MGPLGWWDAVFFFFYKMKSWLGELPGASLSMTQFSELGRGLCLAAKNPKLVRVSELMETRFRHLGSKERVLSLSEGSTCIKANAQSCGECIQVAETCGWCTDEVSWIAKNMLKVFYHMSEKLSGRLLNCGCGVYRVCGLWQLCLTVELHKNS